MEVRKELWNEGTSIRGSNGRAAKLAYVPVTGYSLPFRDWCPLRLPVRLRVALAHVASVHGCHPPREVRVQVGVRNANVAKGHVHVGCLQQLCGRYRGGHKGGEGIYRSSLVSLVSLGTRLI
eukprot:1180023-Prorocentrum_minimum.AAC.2